jgi:hypothetical protein
MAKKSVPNKKPAAKAAAAKKQGAGKPSANAKTGFPVTAKRPPNNPNVPQQTINSITAMFNAIKSELDGYAAHLRALDRRRLNIVGINRQGFIRRAYAFAEETPQFLPHYVTLDKFTQDTDYFNSFNVLHDLSEQIRDVLWNITVQSADAAYTDALEFYASVREASKRRVDPAETIHRDLESFFKKSKPAGEKPTVKRQLRDANAIIRGKKNGKFIAENVKPHLAGGKHKVIDETYKEDVRIKESEDSKIKE